MRGHHVQILTDGLWLRAHSRACYVTLWPLAARLFARCALSARVKLVFILKPAQKRAYSSQTHEHVRLYARVRVVRILSMSAPLLCVGASLCPRLAECLVCARMTCELLFVLMRETNDACEAASTVQRTRTRSADSHTCGCRVFLSARRL